MGRVPSVVVGPFLILLAFGLGYRRSPDPYRTLFVTPAGTLFASQVQNYAQELGKYVRFAGTTEDAATDTPRLLGVLQNADVGPVTVNQITPDYDEVFVAIMREADAASCAVPA